MTGVFTGDYSGVYDLLYGNKNYLEEARYIAQTLRSTRPGCTSLLELGCGTGVHSRLLVADGFEVVGIDLSEGMLERARREQVSGARYICGDIRDVNVEQKFDAVISLFHVISYLNTNDDLQLTFKNARSHLRPGGLFMFDFWYGPAVLTVRPEPRLKEVKDDKFEVFRLSNTTLDVNRNIANVNYTIIARDLSTGSLARTEETHSMRFFFLPELRIFLEAASFRLVNECEWLTDHDLDGATWNGCILAEAI